MKKIETFKNSFIEFDFFKASRVNVLYAKKFGSEFEKDLLDGELTDEKMLFVVEESYKVACQLKGSTPELTSDDFGIKLTSIDLVDCTYLVLGTTRKEVDENQKKTMS